MFVGAVLGVQLMLLIHLIVGILSGRSRGDTSAKSEQFHIVWSMCPVVVGGLLLNWNLCTVIGLY